RSCLFALWSLPRSSLLPYTTLFRSRSGPFDLVYQPSGREPRFVVGSRRGLPYRSKSYYGNFPPRYVPQLATPAWFEVAGARKNRSEEHTSELQSRFDLVCRLLLEKK